MVGRVSETARATQWACATASTVAADRIWMLLVTLKENSGFAKTRVAKARITRVTRTSYVFLQQSPYSLLNIIYNCQHMEADECMDPECEPYF
jgi:hypothetical protein